MRDYESLIEAATEAMMEKLLENDHKSGWEEQSLFGALVRIEQEVEEFREELFDEAWTGGPMIMKNDIDYKKASRELADVMNFCAMGIQTCKRRGES